LSTPIDVGTKKVLITLNKANRKTWVDNTELEQATELSLEDLNDAVELLESKGLVKCLQSLDTAPYKFKSAKLTALGRSTIKQEP
jgi:transcription initiation factor IIE alpha subunit